MNRVKPVPLILASASPRRRAILSSAGFRFKVIPSDLDERRAVKKSAPAVLVQKLALLKADSVLEKVRRGIVIGADTLVVCKGRIIGKPRSVGDARNILKVLSGAWQEVYTGVAVVSVPGYITLLDYCLSKVKMKRLTGDELKMWSARNLDKAGGYAVQEKGDTLIEEIAGDYDNVVGFPMRIVRRLLSKAARSLGHSAFTAING